MTNYTCIVGHNSDGSQIECNADALTINRWASKMRKANYYVQCIQSTDKMPQIVYNSIQRSMYSAELDNLRRMDNLE
jgi:hypothetical protein